MRATRDDLRSRAVAQQACALLLGYPDQTLTDRRPLLAEAIGALPPDTKAPLSDFMAHFAATPIEEIAQHYVETFDMRRKCCPYLTYWTHGDTRNRGMAMLRFKEIYRAGGVTPPEDELPDHLCVALEFAAVGEPKLGNELLGEHRAPIELLRDALVRAQSPYSHVLDAVVATLAPMTAELAERARALAASGPPTELVGVGAHEGLITYGISSRDSLAAALAGPATSGPASVVEER